MFDTNVPHLEFEDATPLCTCGRSADKIHCPACGSAQVLNQSRKRDYITRSDGTKAELRVFRCRVCGGLFNDDDWQLRCSAPAPRTVAIPSEERRRRVEAKLVNRKVADFTQLVPEELKAALDKIKKSRGIE